MAQKEYKQLTKDTHFASFLKQQLKEPAIKKAYNEEGIKLEVAYMINRLRRESKLTQEELALKLQTTQSVVARIEQGRQNFTLDTLQKIAHIFDKELHVEFA